MRRKGIQRRLATPRPISRTEVLEAELFYRDLLGQAGPRRPLRGERSRFTSVRRAASPRRAPFERAEGCGAQPSLWGAEQSEQAYDHGLPLDDEEAWPAFDAEFVEPDPSPNSAGAPFAPLLSGTGHWPIMTSASQGRLVSYRTVDGAWIGRPARSFGANRSGGGRYHIGIDLFGRFGDPVVAIEDGRIVRFFPFCCGENKTSWALLVQHAQVVVNYGEVAPDSLSRNRLSVGSNVTAGQVIGRVGRNPGGSSMVHFETYTTGATRTYRWMKGRTRPTQVLNPTRLLLALQEQGLPRPAGGAHPSTPVPVPAPARSAGGSVVHNCRPGEGPPAAVPDPQGRGLHPLVYKGSDPQYSRNPTVGDAQILLNRFLNGLTTGTYRCAAGVDMAAIQRIRASLTQDPLGWTVASGSIPRRRLGCSSVACFPASPISGMARSARRHGVNWNV
ncbi:MAG: M23 family metallopeptidase [Desulfatitalea sp.]|nr:M23 family metallopeptidase [Desulfatitalea sp.]NNJ98895.1 M23 family metallopeptidase [Desulfatitalea sp.]